MLFRRSILDNRWLAWPAPLGNALFALFIAGILGYGVGFAWHMLAHFNLFHLLEASKDDAFYYFQIAYHLADGKFSTFDGGITRTNGYHPIWMFAVTPFYWIFDKEGALFAIKAFEIMLIAGAVACIAAAVRLARLPWILLFATLPLLYRRSGLFVGMEAAAALFLLALFMLALTLYARNPARWPYPLAVVAFALPWVRLEYIAISLAATAALFVIEWSRQERPAGASFKAAILATPSRTLVPIIGAVAGILTYFAYNGLVFGGIVPVSGATKQAWSEARWEREGGYSFTHNLREVLQIGVFDLELLVALGVCIILVLVWWFARRSRNEQDWLLLVFLVGVFGLAAGHLAKFAQTVLTVHPRYAGDSWYFAPAYLMMALAVPIACYVAAYFIRRRIRPRSPQTTNILIAGVVIVGAVFLFAKVDFAAPFRHIDRITESSGFDYHGRSYAGTLVMNRVLPDASVVGSWDAGVIAYFSRFPTVNLDGLVNNYDFLSEYGGLYGGGVRSDGLKDYAETLQQTFGTTHYAQTWPIKRRYANTIYEGTQHGNIERRLSFKLWATEPLAATPAFPARGADHAAWFWQRMERHLDYQSDGVGFIVDGRLAQAFARDCAPDALAVWSWAEPEHEKLANPWTHTQTGLCVDALPLPRNTPSPAQVAAMPASAYLAELAGNSPPAIRSDFDVYLIANRLVYIREQCQPEDVATPVFLHLVPVSPADLPERRKQHGFDNLDFRFAEYGQQYGTTCVAFRDLPDYNIAAIRTGQYERVAGGFNHLWEGEIRPD